MEDLHDLLTQGYARVHELERQALRLERRSTALAYRDGKAEELAEALRQRRQIDGQLERLRDHLRWLRTAASDGIGD
jgi:hypothetical protein